MDQQTPPVPPQQPNQQQTPPPQPPQQQGGGDSKILAAICYIPIIGLVMYFAKKDDPFVTFHAKQGSVLTIVWIALWILNGILSAIFFSTLAFGLWGVLSTILWLVYLVIGIFALIGFIKAIMGQEWKMPLLGDWAEKFGNNTQPPAQQ